MLTTSVHMKQAPGLLDRKPTVLGKLFYQRYLDYWRCIEESIHILNTSLSMPCLVGASEEVLDALGQWF